MKPKWHILVQNFIFALLLLNTCLLIGAALGLFGAKETLPLAAVLPAQHHSSGLFGNIRLQTEDNLTLPQAQVLINGEAAGNFSSGQLLLRVYEGDILSLDATAYQVSLKFYISAVSANIDTVMLPPFIISNGQTITLAAIRFK